MMNAIISNSSKDQGLLLTLLVLALTLQYTTAWSTTSTRRTSWTRRTTTTLSSSTDTNEAYTGPILTDTSEISTGASLGELGIDIFVAPSTVAPGSLGLYAILSEEDTERATIPAMSLLCGYSREGSFAVKDEGDKTVGFALTASTAVFYDKKLMSIIDALELAAATVGADQACGLAGHVLVQNEEEGVEVFVDADPTFKRYYVPAMVNNQESGGEEKEDGGLSVQNFGQLCNDLAWSFDNPPSDKDAYDAASINNIVQLVWRLEFDATINSLVPSWPVSVLARDVTFDNADVFMELGTRYGWNYWQATVDLDTL